MNLLCAINNTDVKFPTLLERMKLLEVDRVASFHEIWVEDGIQVLSETVRFHAEGGGNEPMDWLELVEFSREIEPTTGISYRDIALSIEVELYP